MKAYYVSSVVWRLLICFVVKLKNIEVVNDAETTVEWEQWVVAVILTLNNTDVSLTFH